MTAIAAAAGATLALIICVVRLFGGPTIYDRMLAANGVVIKLAVIAAAGAVVSGDAVMADAGLAFALALLVANVAVMKVFRAQTFQAPLARAEER